MPQNKRILFPLNRQNTALYAQALCHPARLQLIKLLQEYDFLLCGDLVDLLPLSQSTVSHHLELLLKTNIIIRDETFGAVGYRLNHIGWHNAKSNLTNFFAEVG